MTAFDLQRKDPATLKRGRAVLSARERQALAFFYGRGFRQVDIAAELGISQPRVAELVRIVKRKFLAECGIHLVRPERN